MTYQLPLLSNWLLALGLLLSLTWGQALSESCLAPSSSLPLWLSQQALRGKEGQAGGGPEGGSSRWFCCLLDSLREPGPRVGGVAGSSPLVLFSQAFRACRSLEPLSEFTLEEFDPLDWLSSPVPDSSLSLGVVLPSSLPQMPLATFCCLSAPILHPL